MNMKFSALTFFVFVSMIAQAQDAPPESSWVSDPIDVLENPETPEAQAAEQFKDVPNPAANTVPKPNVSEAGAANDLTLPDFSEEEINALKAEGISPDPQPAPAGDINTAQPNSLVEGSPAAAPTAGTEEVVPPVDVAPAVAAPSAPVKKKYKPYRGYKSSTYGDEVDHQQEAYFHNIYKTYNQSPTPSEAWEQVVGTRRSESYLIQKGDTLWDLSNTLFGDAHYWPKVWALNKEAILNPHSITRGMAVRFYPGTGDEAPTLNLANASDIPKANAGGESTGDTAQNSVAPNGVAVAGTTKAQDNVVIPPPKRKSNPVLKQIPASLPQYEMGALAKQKLKINVQLQPLKFPVAQPFLAYFAAQDEVDGFGEVVGTEVGASTAGDQQIIYVRLKKESGNNYVVQKNHSKVKSKKLLGGSANIVENQGEIQILEKVNDNGTYRALVNKTIQPIEVGSLLVPGFLPMVNVNRTDLQDGVGGTIIGGQFESNRYMMGDEQVVFIDNGLSSGLSVGQTLPIYGNERIRNPKTNAKYNDMVIGHVKIVRVAKDFATGYVLDVTKELHVGDYVGASSNSAPVASSAPVEEDLGDDEFSEMEEAPAAEQQDSGGGDEEFDF